MAPHLADFLPAPLVGVLEEGDDETAPLFGFVTPAKSIGRIKAFHGHFGGGMVRAFTYIAMHGPDGLQDIAQYAVLNANYLLATAAQHLPRAVRPHLHARILLRKGTSKARMCARSTSPSG